MSYCFNFVHVVVIHVNLGFQTHNDEKTQVHLRLYLHETNKQEMCYNITHSKSFYTKYDVN